MQRRLALALALLLIAFSVAGNLGMVLGRTWPTYLFLLVGLLGVIVLVLWFLARTFPSSLFARHVGELSLILIAASVLTFAVEVGATHRETHMLTWSYDAKRVRLVFVDYPDFSINIDSNQLADCLERQPSHQLPGVLEVTTDFGKVRGSNALSVGPCQIPTDAWSYAETQNSGRSPW